MSKCKYCERQEEINKILKALKKIGYIEQSSGDGTINAEIVIKGRTIWEGNVYLKKELSK